MDNPDNLPGADDGFNRDAFPDDFDPSDLIAELVRCLAGESKPRNTKTESSVPVRHKHATATNPELELKVMVAVRCGYRSILERIHKSLSTFHFNFLHKSQETDFHQLTPLLYACKCNQKEVLEWLLEVAKVNKHSKTKSTKETALILAVSNENVNDDMVHCLLAKGDQNLGEKDKHKMTALHIACLKGYLEIAKLIVNLNNAWTAQEKTGKKILGPKELKNKDGNTPLMLAASKNTPSHREIVKVLLKMEKEPSRAVCEEVNKRNLSAVMIAAHAGHLECLKIMHECNAITDVISRTRAKNGWNIIHCAVASGSLETLQWLLAEKAGVLKTTDLLDAPNMKGYTPFLLACEYHHSKIIQYLIELEQDGMVIDINAKTKDGVTGLHLATMHDAVEIVDLLLNYEIDLLAQELKHGKTVLHIATSKSSLRVENRLKEESEYEQLKEIRNNLGETAEDIRNPVHVPIEIRKRGPQSIDAYLKALREGKAKNNHCNLVVLGEERVGKTSLIKSLLGKEFDPNCKSTQGVQLDQIETIAERIEIVGPVVDLPEDERQAEVWEVVNPKKRVRDHYVDTVAEAVADADPKGLQDNEEHKEEISEEDLMHEIDEIIEVLKPQDERNKAAIRIKRKKRPHQQRTTKPERPKKTGQASGRSEDPIPSDPHQSTSEPTASTRTATQAPKSSSPQMSDENPIIGEINRRAQDPVQDRQHPPPMRESISYEDSTAIAQKVKQKRKRKQDNIVFHTIDFAGQSLYRPMHHCFITHRAMYVVVFKLTDLLRHIQNDEQLDKNPISEIRYWLNNIIAHASVARDGDTIEENEKSPKIFLVGTHKNGDKAVQRPLGDDEVKKINEELMNIFVIDVNEKRYRYSIQQAKSEGGCIVFAVENSLTAKHDERRRESGILHFMSRIDAIKERIPFLHEEFPTSYIKLEQKLLEMEEKRKAQPLATTRQEVESWARECGITEQEGINTAVQFYHDIRVIVDQGLISSPFAPKVSGSSNSLVLLSPQWLGDMMCKIVQLKVGNERHQLESMISFHRTGIILESDLRVCLMGKDDGGLVNSEEHLEQFNNLLKILEAYCLIYRLKKPEYKLFNLPEDQKEQLFLIPCRMPESNSKPSFSFSKECYKFEFDFQSYLPEEVYMHCVCKLLSKAQFEAGKDKRKLELTQSCSMFAHFKLNDDCPLADWKIEMDKSRHVLKFSVCPREEDYEAEPRKYITDVDELVLTPVCSKGSLGCLAYKGGPLVNCSCTDDDHMTILPFVCQSPNMENPSPETPYSKCPECDHKIFNVDDELKKQINPNKSETESHVATAPTIINIGSPIAEQVTGQKVTRQEGTREEEPLPQASLVKSVDEPSEISHILLVKTAENYHSKGKKLARYLDMQEEWKEIKRQKHDDEDGEDDEDDEDDIEINKVIKLLKLWVKKPVKEKLKTLKETLESIDPSKVKTVFP